MTTFEKFFSISRGASVRIHDKPASEFKYGHFTGMPKRGSIQTVSHTTVEKAGKDPVVYVKYDKTHYGYHPGDIDVL